MTRTLGIEKSTIVTIEYLPNFDTFLKNKGVNFTVDKHFLKRKNKRIDCVCTYEIKGELPEGGFNALVEEYWNEYR